MGEAFLAALTTSVDVSSAGVDPDEYVADRQAVAAARQYGVDFDGRRSRRLTATMVQDADVILTFERYQSSDVVALDARADCKTFTLLEFVAGCERDKPLDRDALRITMARWNEERGGNVEHVLLTDVPDIADPWGRTDAVFAGCASMIWHACEVVAEVVEGGVVERRVVEK